MAKRGPKQHTLAESMESFMRHVEKTESCWIWTGPKGRRNYGKWGFHRRTVQAHRFIYAASVGPVPAGLCVCHRCDNPPCVNPAHLFLGTHKDNAIDKVQKNRISRIGNRGWRRVPIDKIPEIRTRYFFVRPFFKWKSTAVKILATHYEVKPATIEKLLRF